MTNARSGVARVHVLGASVCIAYEEAVGFYCAGHSSLRSGATGQLVKRRVRSHEISRASHAHPTRISRASHAHLTRIPRTCQCDLTRVSRAFCVHPRVHARVRSKSDSHASPPSGSKVRLRQDPSTNFWVIFKSAASMVPKYGTHAFCNPSGFCCWLPALHRVTTRDRELRSPVGSPRKNWHVE